MLLTNYSSYSNCFQMFGVSFNVLFDCFLGGVSSFGRKFYNHHFQLYLKKVFEHIGCFSKALSTFAQAKTTIINKILYIAINCEEQWTFDCTISLMQFIIISQFPFVTIEMVTHN